MANFRFAWVQVFGTKAIIGQTIQYQRGKGKLHEAAIKDVMRFLFSKTQEVVPVRTGRLKASGRVTFTGSHWKTKAKITYNAPYAMIQHENLQFSHAPGKQAKYVEGPARKFRPQMRRRYERKMRENVLTRGSSSIPQPTGRAPTSAPSIQVDIPNE